MAQKMSELVIKLTDLVSGPARKVAQALKMAERQTKAIAAATKAGISGRMVTDLQRIGATHGQIDRVTRAWDAYRRSAGLAADSAKWTKSQTAAVRTWERANLSALKSVNAAKKQSVPGAARTAGPAEQKRAALLGAAAAPMRYIAPAAIAYSTTRAAKSYAEADRAIKRIGITAEATDKEIEGVGKTAFNIAQEVAMPYAKVVSGLDTLVAQGRNLKDSMAFLPAVSRTAAATNSEVEDIAKTADSMGTNFKIAGTDMQRAFDILAAGGKAGQFELPDMARYLPSMGPAAAAAGFTGEQGLTDLVAMLQIMRKGSGTSEEAAASMLNIFQKMFSEETTKRFNKFGVDLPKAMEKGRKEGRNLVEVFEELTSQALKGDLSKIPQLINDMEFARGIRAILSYKGEWQKLSATIAKTAPGSVVQDLARVTNDAQAKIDKLSNVWENRLRQLGGLVFDIVNPIDEALKRVEKGENSTVNAINDRAKLVVNDHIARQEIETGQRHEYDPDSRREIDARKALLARQRYDDTVSQFDAEIAKLEKVLQGRPVRNARLYAEGRIKELTANREALVGNQRAVDELQVRLAENEAARKSSSTRMGSEITGTPAPITPGIFSFGFGVHGSNLPPEPGETIAPLPPPRPPELPKGVPTLQKFEDIWKEPTVVKPEVDSGSLEAAKDKAAEAKEAVDGLNVTATPRVDLSSLDHLESKVDIIIGKMRQVGELSRSASRSMSAVESAGTPASRGRSEIARATAALSRSRQSNNQDRAEA